MSESLQNLKSKFSEVFPEHAKLLEGARSHTEVLKLQDRFQLESKTKLASALNIKLDSLDDRKTQPAFALKPATYNALINATGGAIEQQLHDLLTSIQSLSKMEDDDPMDAVATMFAGGITSLGLTAIAAYQSKLVMGAVEAAAALAGVEVATLAVVCSIATLVVFTLILPILFYMEKPANCIILLINEVGDNDDSLEFQEDYNVHGKPALITRSILGPLDFGSGQVRYNAGFIAAEKRDNALVGCQYGFTLTFNNGGAHNSLKGQRFTFGVDCPLTGIDGWNNCYCSFDDNAKQAAENTDKHDAISYTAEKNGIKLSIKCNSQKGSIAYYVARVYK
ncbi:MULTISPECIES: hypothetical protein [unclassified Pseudomonas]|uniref:hypothetical protein n=1 Tax=unclassified Pseudomonas TaxID=196821 RepID=UPI002096F102|nr:MULTISPECIES: hypothetical protein [unclassified Pseudomonas]MCO7518330.1 hypothetical protein [Pseudomonas sp. 1]MCO7538778.1 hypothetical protein [Pseudomonas sp. VA159-2]